MLASVEKKEEILAKIKEEVELSLANKIDELELQNENCQIILKQKETQA